MGRKKKRKRVREVLSGPRPIEAVGTSVAAFVGFVRRHPGRAVVTAAAVFSIVAGRAWAFGARRPALRLARSRVVA